MSEETKQVWTPTVDELAKVLDAHTQWLAGPSKGKRADLRSADLRWADLHSADLRSADLSSADLSSADLGSADLRWANLSSADLGSADLGSADLRSADLGSANLRWANLRSADLRWANLSSANLRWADLHLADLRWASLPTGESWEKYLSEVVPALLTAGGKPLSAVATLAHWNCHQWANCPMAAAFGVTCEQATPLLLRPRIQQFVQFFDAQLIPLPAVSQPA